MKKLLPFKLPFLAPALTKSGKQNVEVHEDKPPAVTGEKKRIKRYLGCSRQGGVFVQTIEIAPDGQSACIIDGRKVRKGAAPPEQVAQEAETQTEAVFEGPVYFKVGKSAAECPYCGNTGEFRCPECGTLSCSGDGQQWVCPVCNFKAVLGSRKFLDRVSGNAVSGRDAKTQLAQIDAEKAKALPNLISGLLPKRKD